MSVVLVLTVLKKCVDLVCNSWTFSICLVLGSYWLESGFFIKTSHECYNLQCNYTIITKTNTATAVVRSVCDIHSDNLQYS